MTYAQPSAASGAAFGAEAILLIAVLLILVTAALCQIGRCSRRPEPGGTSAMPVRIADPCGAGPWSPRRSTCQWRAEARGADPGGARWRCASCGADGGGFAGAAPAHCAASLRSRPV